MAPDSQKQYPKFKWDYDVPDIPFWTDLPFTTARNFLTCFSAEELDVMSFPEDLSKEEKLMMLKMRLQDKWVAGVAEHAPEPLYEAANEAWAKLMLGIYTMHRELKESDQAFVILNEMEKHGTHNTKMASKNMRSDMYAEAGRYSEAEAMGRECLAWLRGLPQAGPDSPMALGCQRRLMAAMWKQGKHDEAKDMKNEIRGLVEGLDGSKFEKYMEEEKQMLNDLVKELEDWGAAKENNNTSP